MQRLAASPVAAAVTAARGTHCWRASTIHRVLRTCALSTPVDARLVRRHLSSAIVRDADVPTIDLQRHDPLELRHTAHSVGFFALSGHGIDISLQRRVLDAARRFFDCPHAVKAALDGAHSPTPFRGYMGVGTEHTLGMPDLKESLDFGPEEPAPPRPAGSPDYLALRGPNVWPKETDVPGLRATLEEYFVAMDALGSRVTQALARCLMLPDDTFSRHFDQAFWQMRLSRYQPSGPAAGDDADGAHQGIGPHTDPGCVTMILYDGSSGLELRDVHGEWRRVQAPPEGCLMVNLGEAMQAWTRGFFVATPHRVVNVASGTARHSVPYFYDPSLEAHIEPVELPDEVWLNADPERDEARARHGDTFVNSGELGTGGGTYGVHMWELYKRAYPLMKM